MFKQIQDSLSWLIDFISKPLAGWSFTIALAIFGYNKIEDKYKEGVLEGKSNSVAIIESLEKSVQNDNLQIVSLQLQLDDCNKISKEDVSETLDKKYKEMERIKRVVDAKYGTSKELNTNLKNINLKNDLR